MKYRFEYSGDIVIEATETSPGTFKIESISLGTGSTKHVSEVKLEPSKPVVAEVRATPAELPSFNTVVAGFAEPEIERSHTIAYEKLVEHLHTLSLNMIFEIQETRSYAGIILRSQTKKKWILQILDYNKYPVVAVRRELIVEVYRMTNRSINNITSDGWSLHSATGYLYVNYIQKLTKPHLSFLVTAANNIVMRDRQNLNK